MRNSAVLHAGSYCPAMQVAGDGGRVLPVEHGCLFNLTSASDLIATDSADYSVSEVIGSAQIGVRGPADGKVIVQCRLDPRAAFWFWIGGDGDWNVSQATNPHHLVDLVQPAQVAALSHFIKQGALNSVQFRCSGGTTQRNVALAFNVNGQQFASFVVPLPDAAATIPLTRTQTPWFVDIGVRLTATGEKLDGTVATLTLYGGD